MVKQTFSTQAEAELKAQEVKAPRKKIAIKRDVAIPAVTEEEEKPDEPVVVEKENEIVAVEVGNFKRKVNQELNGFF